MRLRRKRLGVLLGLLGASIGAYAIGKDTVKFQPQAANDYETKQTISGVTIAAQAFDTEGLSEKAFGKVNPYERGILPVLVVIQNDTKQVIRLEGMSAVYQTPSRDAIESTPASDLPYITGPKRPNFNGQLPIPLPKKKNPLADQVLQERAFAAKMIPPGDSAYGFFYYQTGHRRGSQMYIKGLKDAATGKELFFFEIPL